MIRAFAEARVRHSILPGTIPRQARWAKPGRDATQNGKIFTNTILVAQMPQKAVYIPA
jgi:hypothetical protein